MFRRFRRRWLAVLPLLLVVGLGAVVVLGESRGPRSYAQSPCPPGVAANWWANVPTEEQRQAGETTESQVICGTGEDDPALADGPWLSELMLQPLPDGSRDRQFLGAATTSYGPVAVLNGIDPRATPECPHPLTFADALPAATEAITQAEARGVRVGLVMITCEDARLVGRETLDHKVPAPQR